MKKIYTATFTGYSADASYYINGDATGYDYDNLIEDGLGDKLKENANTVIDEMRADYGPSAYIVGCGETSFFDTPDYGRIRKGDCIEYTIIYDPIETIAKKHTYSFLHSDGERITGEYWNMKSDMAFPTRGKLLPWQERGLMCTSTGYGTKIPTAQQLFILGRWRRIYCDIFSNNGVCYVIVNGQEVHVDSCNMEV